METASATVLAVEDDERVASLVRHVLEAEGYDVVAASTNQDAWAALVEHRPAMLVVDVRLAGGDDGFEFVQRLRGDLRFAALPIVVLTGLVSEEVLERARALGCDYLTKPFSSSALVDKVRRGATAAPSPQEARHVAMEVVETVLLLPDYRVTGHVHLPQEIERFSDAWESVMRDGRRFVPVTDAVIATLDGTRELSKVRFLAVAKEHVRGVFPVE